MRIRESEDFIAIRNNLIDRLIVAMFGLVILALAGSFYRMMETGLQPVMVVHVLASLVFGFMYLCRNHFSSSVKGAVMVGTLFLAGVAGLFNFGLVSAGTMILLVSGLLAGLVLTTRIAIMVLLAGALLQIGFMLAVNRGIMSFNMPLQDYALTLPAWINNLTGYLVLSGISLFVIDRFFTYLKDASAKLQEAVEEKHQELEHSEILLQTVLNSLPYGVFWKKPDLTYWGANQRFVKDSGFKTMENLLGKSDAYFKSDVNTQRYLEEDQQVLNTGESLPGIVTQSINPDGEEVYTRTNKLPLIDKQNKVIGVLGAYEDVTESKRMEKALQEAVMATQQASQAKSEFLATMSHEIRTPINGVMGLLELTLDTQLGEKQREYINKANLSAQTLLQIINQILDISKIEAGKMELEKIPFCVADVLQQLDSQLRHLALAKHLKLDIQHKGEVTQRVAGDPTKLLQVLVNLTSNAIKFTDSGSVSVEVGALKQSDRLKLQIIVLDTGIGMSEDEQKNLFEFFTQAESSTSRRFGGTGLGLAIVKQLVEMQGGNIQVNSQKGEGTRFIVRIDYDIANSAIQQECKLHCADLIGVQVLLAEDNEINQLITCEMLNQVGAEVTVAADGAIALQKLEEQQFDVVLMDIQMPGVDGTEALIKIRQNSRLSRLPVIALTANVLAHEVKFYQEIGFNGHLGKPFQKEQLVSKLHEVLAS